MKRMNPQVEIKVSTHAHTPGLQEWSALIKAKVQSFLESINKPFCEMEFAAALSRGAYWRLTLCGIDFKIKPE